MKFILYVLCYFLINPCAWGQEGNTNWYSASVCDGVIIQNSFPKGGPYKGQINKHYNYSYLVFFTHVINETEDTIELNLDFAADSIPIPKSPNTFMKLFLPLDTMTAEKQSLFSYGITKVAALDMPTNFQRLLEPNEGCMFYVVAVFYQTVDGAWLQERGGNRMEIFMDGRDLYCRMPPQIDALHCGHIDFQK